MERVLSYIFITANVFVLVVLILLSVKTILDLNNPIIPNNIIVQIVLQQLVRVFFLIMAIVFQIKMNRKGKYFISISLGFLGILMYLIKDYTYFL